MREVRLTDNSLIAVFWADKWSNNPVTIYTTADYEENTEEIDEVVDEVFKKITDTDFENNKKLNVKGYEVYVLDIGEDYLIVVTAPPPK